MQQPPRDPALGTVAINGGAATDRSSTRSVSARHNEVGVSDVEFLRGELRARRWWLPGSWGGTVRSALQEDRQRVATNAPSGLGRAEWDVNKLVSGSRVDVRRRWRRTSPCDVLSLYAQLRSVVGGQHSRMTGSVGEREAGGEAGARAAGPGEHRGMGLLGGGSHRRAGGRGRRRCRGNDRSRSDCARPRRANTRSVLRERDRAACRDSRGQDCGEHEQPWRCAHKVTVAQQDRGARRLACCAPRSPTRLPTMIETGELRVPPCARSGSAQRLRSPAATVT